MLGRLEAQADVGAYDEDCLACEVGVEDGGNGSELVFGGLEEGKFHGWRSWR